MAPEAVPEAGAAVRPADLTSSTDVLALCSLRWEWRLDRGERPPNPRPVFEHDFTEWCAQHAATHRAFLAEIGGDGVGMAWYGVYDRVPGPEHWTRRSGSVQSVYVTPSAREAGIGATLIRALLVHAAAEGLDHLLLHPTDRSAPLYRRLGFAPRDQAMEIDLRALPSYRPPLA